MVATSKLRILSQDNYKPGDLPPEGYLAWHEWAEVQYRAGIKQTVCCRCGLWRTPQELSDKAVKTTLFNSEGKKVNINERVCNKCESK